MAREDPVKELGEILIGVVHHGDDPEQAFKNARQVLERAKRAKRRIPPEDKSQSNESYFCSSGKDTV